MEDVGTLFGHFVSILRPSSTLYIQGTFCGPLAYAFSSRFGMFYPKNALCTYEIFRNTSYKAKVRQI
jgi:hypothetical protein